MIRHLAALGSSFAAGPGIEPVDDRRAMRSARNYPHLVAARLGARLTDLTVSGATTATILTDTQRLGWRTFDPQVPQLPADADVVTVTAGGNDLGYLGTMIRLGHAGLLRRRLLTRPLAALLGRGGVTRPGPEAVGAAADGLADVVAAARERAPSARVLLVDYLTILGPETPAGPQAPFDRATRDALRALGDDVAAAFVAAAARSGAELVRVSERSRGHEVGSAEPWVSGMQVASPAAFHPNAAGMRAVADAIVEHLH